MPEPGSLLIWCLALCAVGGALVWLAPQRWLFVGLVAAECLAALGAASTILAGGGRVELALWQLSSFGGLVLVLDPLAALFVTVTAIVFVVGVVLAAREAASQPRARMASFAALYQLLFGAIVLVLVAGDIISFIIGWELMSLLIFALVAFDAEQDSAGRAGYVMLALSEAGAIAGLLGLLLLAVAADGIDFASVRGLAGLAPGLRWAVFLLTFFGFGVKAGLLPVNQWLPDAYVASPRGFTPVLAGATTNLGIYAILRINADLLPPISMGPGLVALIIGSLSALVGILYATIELDLRRALAHSSIENMGIIIAALGAGPVFTAAGHSVVAGIALIAGLYHLVNHSFYKALLFTGAGVIEARVGTTDMDRLGGLIRGMPWTAALFLVGVLAIAALPPLNGFVSEWLTLQTMLRAALLSSTVVKIVFALSGAVLALTAGLAVTCFAKVFAMSFLGMARSAEAARIGEGPSGGRVPMAALGLLCLLLGVLPTYVVPVIDRTVEPIVHASAKEALVPPFFAPQLAEAEGISPAFMAEFHDLGAQTGRDLLARPRAASRRCLEPGRVRHVDLLHPGRAGGSAAARFRSVPPGHAPAQGPAPRGLGRWAAPPAAEHHLHCDRLLQPGSGSVPRRAPAGDRRGLDRSGRRAFPHRGAPRVRQGSPARPADPDARRRWAAAAGRAPPAHAHRSGQRLRRLCAADPAPGADRRPRRALI